VRDRPRLLTPGVVTVPRLAQSPLRSAVDVRLPHEELRNFVQLREIIAWRRTARPTRASPNILLDRLDVAHVLGRRFVSSTEVAAAVEPAMPKFEQIDLAWPMCRNPLGSGGNRVAGARPNRPVATSSATISRMKSRFGGAAVTTRKGARGLGNRG
jgi:hypothetical protein